MRRLVGVLLSQKLSFLLTLRRVTGMNNDVLSGYCTVCMVSLHSHARGLYELHMTRCRWVSLHNTQYKPLFTGTPKAMAGMANEILDNAPLTISHRQGGLHNPLYVIDLFIRYSGPEGAYSSLLPIVTPKRRRVNGRNVV